MHYDHLDYKTIDRIKSKVGKVVTGLGVGAHFERWGFAKENIIELDWNEIVDLTNGCSITAKTGRHFSGRTTRRNNTLWISFILKTPTSNLYLGGDSGYDTHFKQIVDAYGPFDLAILECGQYNEYWKYIHMMPEETAQAAIDLKATKLLPVHWAKFALSLHAWDEPIERVTNAANEKSLQILTPMIGEKLLLTGTNDFREWWKKVR